jgi:Bacterial Ig domain
MPVVTLTPLNSNVYYAELHSKSPDTNDGWESTTVSVGASSTDGSKDRLQLFFDFGLIPNDATINSATLKLRVFNGNSSPLLLAVHPIVGQWDRGTTTWNNPAPYDQAIKSPAHIPVVTGGTVVNLDVTDVVRVLVSNGPYGLLLKIDDENTAGGVTFYSSLSSTTDLQLVINYTIPSTGKKCVEYVGKSDVVKTSNASNVTITLPSGVQQGDLLLACLVHDVEASAINPPAGWTQLFNNSLSVLRMSVFYKVAGASEQAPVFSGTSGKWTGSLLQFRNVKTVGEVFSKAFSSAVTSHNTPATNTVYDKTLLLLFSGSEGDLGNAIYPYPVTPPISFNEVTEVQNSTQPAAVEISYKYMHDRKSTAVDEYTVQLSGASKGGMVAVYLEPVTNNPPTLTLTSPTNNQTLSEGNVFSIQGSAGDTDNGNVVTVKFKINGGTARAIASGVSDGSSPISFARTLTYSNKRLWDGSTDVAGVDLAEGVDHTLTVWAEDDQGGKSAEVTRKFRVIWNRPPVISGANEDLGTIMVPPSKAYTVTEPEGNPFTITEKINGNVIRSFEGVTGREETVTIPHDLWIRLDLDTPHSLTVEATDSKGLTSTRTFTFTRKETHIEFMLDFDNPDVEAHFTLDGMPKRVLVTLERYLPPGSSIEFVRVCNNALDEVPTWEDATAAVTAGRGYLFTNQEKTAENWRINIWVSIAKGTATERVRLDGFGGAFD